MRLLVHKKRYLVIIAFWISILLISSNNNRLFQSNMEKIVPSSTNLIHQLEIQELSIGIFYDGKYSEPWNFQSQALTTYLNQSLRMYNLTVFVLNATQLRSFMENNPIGIIIITMGIAPSNIWDGTENSFIETWLDNGGIILWTGCQEFYWIGYETGVNVPIGTLGAKYVLDMDYIKSISNLNVNPTEIGYDFIENFSAHTTDIFCSIEALSEANVYYEVYAKNGDLADPILFQPKDGKGYFVRIHADYNNQVSIKDLSTWISSLIYNRFFRIPVVSEINSINNLFLLTSKKIFINITNFSEFSELLIINSTSSGFLPINDSFIIKPIQKINFSFDITPLSTARFQEYKIVINFYSNYTSSQNISKFLCFYSKIIYISIQLPISIEFQNIEEEIYPGYSYSLSMNLHKHIDPSFTVIIVVFSEGCFNEITTSAVLDKNCTEIQIHFTIQLMAEPGPYEIVIRIYQGEILFLSESLGIEIRSFFQSPIFVLLLALLLVISLIFGCLYIYQRRKKIDLDHKLQAILEPHKTIFLKDLVSILNLDEKELENRIESCLKRKILEGYLVYNEKEMPIYIKKSELENFVMSTIKNIKSSDLYQIAKKLNISHSELEGILMKKIKIGEN